MDKEILFFRIDKAIWIPKGTKMNLNEEKDVLHIEMPYPAGSINIHFSDQTISLLDLLEQFISVYEEIVTPKTTK